jgi:alanyl-tRNA synthetase
MDEYKYYWQDPLKNQYDITIESIIEADDQTFVRISEPVVKPSGGGQAGDRGFVEVDGKTYEFVDTVLQDSNSLLVMKQSPSRGKRGVLKLDMKWRIAMMRNHTSEHLFVGILKKKHQDLNLGRIWIDGNHGTVILHGDSLPIEDILEAESQVQGLIAQGIPVETRIVSADQVDSSVRAREGLTDKHDIVRIVNIGNADSSACSGIHVTNTSEIRMFKIIDVKTLNNETHIEFVSGDTAIDLVIKLFNMALTRKYSYPFEFEQLGAILDKAKALQESYMGATQKIIELMTTGPHKEEINNIEFWYEYLPGFDASTMREVLKELEAEKAAVILFFAPGVKTSVILWTKNMPKDAAYYIQDIVSSHRGRGGGRGESYSGGFTEVEDPMVLYQEITEFVRKKIQESL